MALDKEFSFSTIGIVHSCFKEKFGVPRQPGLVPASTAQLELLPPYNRVEAVEGLQHVSHIWLQFIFHEFLGQAWKPTVRPPRLGGNKRMGVFATRSPVRPNALGLSVVKLERIETNGAQVILHLSGIDLIDGTPVVDIKPYVPYVDCIDEAKNNFANEAPEPLAVTFSSEAEQACQHCSARHSTDVAALIVQVLQQDPRPSYQAFDAERTYGMKLLDVDVQWQYRQDMGSKEQLVDRIEVVALTPLANHTT